MRSEGVRLSFDLVTLMQLNLVRRRLTTMAHGGSFVHPDDIRGLVEIMNEYLPTEWDIHSLYTGGHHGQDRTPAQHRATRPEPKEGLGEDDYPVGPARG